MYYLGTNPFDVVTGEGNKVYVNESPSHRKRRELYERDRRDSDPAVEYFCPSQSRNQPHRLFRARAPGIGTKTDAIPRIWYCAVCRCLWHIETDSHGQDSYLFVHDIDTDIRIR